MAEIDIEKMWEKESIEARKQLQLEDGYTVFLIGREADYFDEGNFEKMIAGEGYMGLRDQVSDWAAGACKSVKLPKGHAMVGLHKRGEPEVYAVVDFTSIGYLG